jgi:ribosomal-protein-alanine N-acetyltransferase
VLQYFPNTQPPTLDKVSALIDRQLDHWQKHGYGWWAVEHRSSSRLVGWCGLQYLSDTDEVEVAYHISRDHWGRGLATEAASAAVDYGFRTVGLPAIIALAHPDNSRSQRVIEKLGMAFIEETVYFGIPVRKYRLVYPGELPRRVAEGSGSDVGGVSRA